MIRAHARATSVRGNVRGPGSMTGNNRHSPRIASVKTPGEIETLLKEPSKQALFDFWNETRGKSLVPSAPRIDPALIVSLLKDLVIFDFLGKTDVRYRLAGTLVAERMEHELTGKNIIEMLGTENRELVAQMFEQIAMRPVGSFAEYENIYKSGKRAVIHSLYLPLGKTGETSPRILSTHTQHKTLSYGDKQPSVTIAASITKIIWIDIGAGVPAMGHDEG